MVTHNLNIAEMATTVIKMSDGKVTGNIYKMKCKRPLTRLFGDNMLIGIKNVSKLIGISIIASLCRTCVYNVLNFYFDIQLIENEITSELLMVFIMLRFLLQKLFAS